MAQKIEDYGIIGDTQTAALVSRTGSIDWLCVPRFDSGACFAALLGNPEHGAWSIAPLNEEDVIRSQRQYRPGTLILETEFTTAGGTVRVTDCMPLRKREPELIRIVEGVSGRVKMRLHLCIRFDYGSVVPWVRQVDDHMEAIGGPDALSFWSAVETHGEHLNTVAEFEVKEGDRLPFTLLWHASHETGRKRSEPFRAVEDTERWWREWNERADPHSTQWPQPVQRSLMTLKALTYAPTGGIVAAATTSLPEKIGGVRNWDYRFCWLRDAAFTLDALLTAGYTVEACAWRDWLLRAVAGDPSQLQIMYGVAGERRLEEFEVPWFPGYEGSKPVRLGNGATRQFQLDVYGQLFDAMHEARNAGLEPSPSSWNMQRVILEFLESAWKEPDEGIWEVRGPRRHFTHSKVMAWLAFDRAVKAVEKSHLDGPLDRWKWQREQIRKEVLERGVHPEQHFFVQEYGTDRLDASLLMLPLVGFLPADDHRIRATVAAVERHLMEDGFVRRYVEREGENIDGLPPGEGTFLFCTFWLADNYALAGRKEEALETFERLLSIRNDLGLMAEQYDPKSRRMLGNFPQAFSHVGLVNTAWLLSQHRKDVERNGDALSQ